MDQQLDPNAGPRMPEISDENLTEAAPRVRALIVSRIEKMYAQVDRHMDQAEAGDRMLDPRMLEIGKGLMKAQADLYRLSKPTPAAELEEDQELAAVDRRALVSARLDELEAKRQARQSSAGGQDQAGAVA